MRMLKLAVPFASKYGAPVNVIRVSRFPATGQLALIAREAGGGEVRLSVALEGVTLAPNEALIKDYSEGEGNLDGLIRSGVVEPTGVGVMSGWVTLPVVRVIHPDFIP